MVKCLTDNVNRTVSEVRAAFNKQGGNLGTDGSVAYLFTHQGQILFSAETDEDELMEAALEAGADDVVAEDDGSFMVLTSFTDYLSVKEGLAAAGFVGEGALTMEPSTKVELDVDGAGKILRLIDVLEDLDDVQDVYTNADISEEVMAQLEEA